jgi:hypothetical protein
MERIGIVQLTDASMSDLATELQKAELALAIGLSRREDRKWKAYRGAIRAEIDRRAPISPELQAMTDAELLKALES